ncbi:MAG: sulfopyruvate decarboxylase subunit alpha [Acidobacteria bacterium]|nr:sulfopyruvate decarboxylase subunit alpha [Acidobacteriota bacterium]
MKEPSAEPRQPAPTAAGIPAWARAIAAGVAASGSRDVVFVPDNPLSHILGALRDAHREVRVIPATREEEAIGIAAGLYLGGSRPTVMMQSSGLGNSANAIGSLIVAYQIPALLVLSMRGDPGEWNWAQVPFGRAVPPLLDALGIQYVVADRAETSEESVRLAARLAFDTRCPAACLLPRRLTTPIVERSQS